MTLYAAYGTNLDPARMSERCPHSILQATGWLTGWRLTFGGEEHGWDGALSTIVQDPFEQVFVAVYDVTSEDERALDGGGMASMRLDPLAKSFAQILLDLEVSVPERLLPQPAP